MPDAGRQAALRGVALALAVSVPAALVAQIIEVVTDDDPGLLAYPLALAVLGGMAVGGGAVGLRVDQREAGRLGALTGLVAIGVVQGLGVARRAAAGEEVAWASVPVVTVLGVALAAGAALLTARRAGRTRP